MWQDTNFLKKNPFCEANTHLANYPHFTEPQGSLRGHTVPPLVPILRQMTAVHTILLHVFKSPIPTIFSLLSLPSLQDFITKIMSPPTFPPMRSVCPTQLLPVLITLISFRTEHKPCSSSQCNILSFLPPSIFLSTLLSKILSLRTFSSINLKDHVSYPYKTTNTVTVLYVLTDYVPCIRQMLAFSGFTKDLLRHSATEQTIIMGIPNLMTLFSCKTTLTE